MDEELDMQGEMMQPQMQPQMQPEMSMGQVSQAEMQEAQGALQQILQMIQQLVEQGLSEEEIMQFLAQYGISEAELDQASQILGVDIDQIIGGGQMQAPQQPPMMMATGGPMQQGLGISNERLLEISDPANRGVDSKIFSVDVALKNLMSTYDMAVRNKEFQRAQNVANEIDQMQQVKIQLQATKVPQ